MAERYNSVLRYDVLAVCRTAFRTGNESNYGGGVLRDDSGTLLLRGGGIRGAMRKWVQEQADREDFERLFGGERLRFSDGVFFPETSVNVRAGSRMDAARGVSLGGVFRMEVIPAESRFRFCIIWQGQKEETDRTAERLERLLAALDRGEIVLGGYNAQGFGRVTLEVTRRMYDLSREADRNDWLAPAAAWPEVEPDPKAVAVPLGNGGEGKTVRFRLKGRMEKVFVGGDKRGEKNVVAPFEENGRLLIPAASVRGVIKAHAEGICRSVGVDGETVLRKMFGLGAYGRKGIRGQVICSDAALIRPERRTGGRIWVDRTGGARERGLVVDAVGGDVCLELSAPHEGEICALLMLTLRDLALGICGIGANRGIGLGRLQGECLTADIPGGGRVTMSFDGEGNATLDDPEGITAIWMEKWREYCGHGA